VSFTFSDLADDLRHVYLSTIFELRKHYRRRRLLVTAMLSLILPVLFYVVPLAFDVSFPDLPESFASRNLGFVVLLITISGALFAGDGISGEFESKTGLLVFPTPQRRNSIFVGKYLAAVFGTWMGVGVYYLVTSVEVAHIYGLGRVSEPLARSLLLAILYSTSVVSLIYFLSSTFRRSITSTLLGFFSLLMILPIVGGVLSFVDVDPWFILTTHGDLITRVFNLGPSVRFAGRSVEYYTPDFYQGIAVMTAYAVVLLVVALGIANRKEFVG